MKKNLRGVKRQDIQLDFDLYRVRVPIPAVEDAYLSVLDLYPEGADRTILFLHGYAGVLELVREKSKWGQEQATSHRGVSAYFCHSTYAAHVLDLNVKDGQPVVEKVTCAIDCGVVVNPDAAKNMAEGGIIDGIGNAFYGELTFKDI